MYWRYLGMCIFRPAICTYLSDRVVDCETVNRLEIAMTELIRRIQLTYIRLAMWAVRKIAAHRRKSV